MKILDFRPSEIISGAVLGQNSRSWTTRRLSLSHFVPLVDLLASYPGYEANVRGYTRSQASQASFGTQGAMARLTRARICDCRSSVESSLKRKTKGTVNIGPAMAVLVE